VKEGNHSRVLVNSCFDIPVTLSITL